MYYLFTTCIYIHRYSYPMWPFDILLLYHIIPFYRYSLFGIYDHTKDNNTAMYNLHQWNLGHILKKNKVNIYERSCNLLEKQKYILLQHFWNTFTFVNENVPKVTYTAPVNLPKHNNWLWIDIIIEINYTYKLWLQQNMFQGTILSLQHYFVKYNFMQINSILVFNCLTHHI